MLIKGLVDEDFVNYKIPSLYIIFPYCSFKCGTDYCQNSNLAHEPLMNISVKDVVARYLNNPITGAIVCGGLEPFDSFDDLLNLITELRFHTKDDIVIYTGYEKNEILKQIWALSMFDNIIVKYGRYKPNDEGYFNDLLGVHLASKNQYVEKWGDDYKISSGCCEG